MISINLLCCFKKDVYPFKYMSNWEEISKTSLPEKDDFSYNVNMEDITDAEAECTYTKGIC